MELPDKPNHATLEERREKLDERRHGPKRAMCGGTTPSRLGPLEAARLHRQHQVAPQALVVGDEAVVEEQLARDAARASGQAFAN
jgi:hypothetical protein